ncbi:ATP-binding domain-containing protein [Chryseobacterium sp.]|uniref:ATP-binding domain-containing protein n=1 Tax=Chryseobacterium sp. TaxID=1871047 RepID=UPI0012A865C2|nr:ATP-binding domain-containing protein [Chryseobacterium sp.]QFG53192.1 hypothetical protein F7R58_06410 [Chryseobacterium sp.]
MYLPSSDAIPSLYTIIHENSLNKGIHPNDITILGTKIKLLKDFDSHYRHRTGEKTNTMFESHEDLLIAGMNYSQTEIKYNREHWINVALLLLNHKNEKSFSDGFKRLAELLICKTQVVQWPEFFETRYTALCRKNKINPSDFDAFVSRYDRDIKNFMKRYSENALSSDAKRIRDNKKIHFWANRGTVKLSTIHSFKGWESDLVYLIIENVPESMAETFFELIYTGITRARYNLIILNYGNEIFHQQFLPVYNKALKKLEN